MINMNSMNLALNIKANDVCTAIGIDACFSGFNLAGGAYEPSPSKNYIRWDLIPNDIERRGLANGESEVMRSGIYQATVNVSKSVSKLPNMDLAKIVDAVRSEFTQGLNLSNGGQSCVVTYSQSEIALPSDTYESKPISIYFNCIA